MNYVESRKAHPVELQNNYVITGKDFLFNWLYHYNLGEKPHLISRKILLGYQKDDISVGLAL